MVRHESVHCRLWRKRASLDSRSTRMTTSLPTFMFGSAASLPVGSSSTGPYSWRSHLQDSGGTSYGLTGAMRSQSEKPGIGITGDRGKR